jgi:hypothetical protein
MSKKGSPEPPLQVLVRHLNARSDVRIIPVTPPRRDHVGEDQVAAQRLEGEGLARGGVDPSIHRDEMLDERHERVSKDRFLTRQIW